MLRARFPDIEIIGSYDPYTAEEPMERIKKATAASDDLVVLFTAGPPCPDFSRINGSTSKGRNGPECEKFVKFVELLRNLRAAADSRGWGVHFVVENVVMNEHEAHYFNTQLGVQSFVMDAGDITCASRPRLWWTSFLNGEESALRMAKKDTPALKLFTSMKEGLIHLIMPIKKLSPASLIWGNVHSVTDGMIASCGLCRLHGSVRKATVGSLLSPHPQPNWAAAARWRAACSGAPRARSSGGRQTSDCSRHGNTSRTRC